MDVTGTSVYWVSDFVAQLSTFPRRLEAPSPSHGGR